MERFKIESARTTYVALFYNTVLSTLEMTETYNKIDIFNFQFSTFLKLSCKHALSPVAPQNKIKNVNAV